MKIAKQKNKFNQYNIENLTLARLNQILIALEFTKNKGLLTFAGNQLLEALNSQISSKSYLK
jgi:hypothetical protein